MPFHNGSIGITSGGPENHHSTRNITFSGNKDREDHPKTSANECLLLDFEMIMFKSEETSFDVSNLELENLESVILPGPQLEQFNASQNMLWDIPTNFFIDTPNLLVIDLSYNLFTKTDSYDFDGASKVIRVHFSKG